MNTALQYTPKLNPETREPYGWVGWRSDRPHFLYWMDTFGKWHRFAKVAISDTATAVTRAATGQTLGSLLEQHYGTSYPIWLEEAKLRYSARNWLKLLESAHNQGKVAWPPFDESIGETS